MRACIAPPTDADKMAAAAAATRNKQHQQQQQQQQHYSAEQGRVQGKAAGGSTMDVGVRLGKLPTNKAAVSAVQGQGLAPGAVGLGGRSVSSGGLLEGTDPSRRRSYPHPSPVIDDNNLSLLSASSYKSLPVAGTGSLDMEGEGKSARPFSTITPYSSPSPSSSSSSMFVPYLPTGGTAATAMLLPRLIALSTSPVLVECIPPSPRGQSTPSPRNPHPPRTHL